MHIYALTPVNLLPAKNMHLSCYADTWMNKLIQMQMCFSDNLINTGNKNNSVILLTWLMHSCRDYVNHLAIGMWADLSYTPASLL